MLAFFSPRFGDRGLAWCRQPAQLAWSGGSFHGGSAKMIYAITMGYQFWLSFMFRPHMSYQVGMNWLVVAQWYAMRCVERQGDKHKVASQPGSLKRFAFQQQIFPVFLCNFNISVDLNMGDTIRRNTFTLEIDKVSDFWGPCFQLNPFEQRSKMLWSNLPGS